MAENGKDNERRSNAHQNFVVNIDDSQPDKSAAGSKDPAPSGGVQRGVYFASAPNTPQTQKAPSRPQKTAEATAQGGTAAQGKKRGGFFVCKNYP